MTLPKHPDICFYINRTYLYVMKKKLCDLKIPFQVRHLFSKAPVSPPESVGSHPVVHFSEEKGLIHGYRGALAKSRKI